MSEVPEMSAPIAETAANQQFAVTKFPQGVEGNATIKGIEQSLDGQSYFLGEVPQSFLADPQAFLPLNSDRLMGSVNMIEMLLADVNLLIQEEVGQIQKAQKKIALWEDRVAKNKAIIEKNLAQIKQNLIDIAYDKKNRDYWLGRSEEVLLDYVHAEAASRQGDWSWIVKKYGLKNPDGSAINEKNSCVEELCNGAANNLAAEYKINGNKYEASRKDRETINTRMIRDNGLLKNTNDDLQNYIANLYANQIEPLQDGILLYKELVVKLKALEQTGQAAVYGDLRSWAEEFLDEFLKANSRVHQYIVTEFRRLSSIPLPAKNS